MCDLLRVPLDVPVGEQNIGDRCPNSSEEDVGENMRELDLRVTGGSSAKRAKLSDAEFRHVEEASGHDLDEEEDEERSSSRDGQFAEEMPSEASEGEEPEKRVADNLNRGISSTNELPAELAASMGLLSGLLPPCSTGGFPSGMSMSPMSLAGLPAAFMNGFSQRDLLAQRELLMAQHQFLAREALLRAAANPQSDSPLAGKNPYLFPNEQSIPVSGGNSVRGRTIVPPKSTSSPILEARPRVDGKPGGCHVIPSSTGGSPPMGDEDEDDYGEDLMEEGLLDGEDAGSVGCEDKPVGEGLGGEHNSGSSGHQWTFEEQFKQLYELSVDTKRKEFLDDLFSFMQKRGTPVNRIPIMAKQVLDLYELFRLVASKGGLVEVINKKLWREITKGLNLPSSITSAAFTLRTQYMKYLYPYECETLKLSSPGELQAAIDGNRREARRPSYSFEYPLMLGSGSGQVPPGMSAAQMCPPPPGNAAVGGPGGPAQSPAVSIGALFAAHCQQNFAGAAAAAAGLMAPGGGGVPGGMAGMAGMAGAMRSPGNLRLPTSMRDNRIPRMPLGLKQETSDHLPCLSPQSGGSSEAASSVSPSNHLSIPGGGNSASKTSTGSPTNLTTSAQMSSVFPSDYLNNNNSSNTPAESISPSLSQHKRSSKHLSTSQQQLNSNRHHNTPSTGDPANGDEVSHGLKMSAPGAQLSQSLLAGIVPSPGSFPQPPPRSGFFPPAFPSIPLSTSHMRMATQPGSHLGMPDNALVVSMDMNGLLYQGVLFAQPKRF